MAFTQPCYIRKNTPELRKKLEELGYKIEPTYSPFDGQEYSVKEILKMFNDKN